MRVELTGVGLDSLDVSVPRFVVDFDELFSLLLLIHPVQVGRILKHSLPLESIEQVVHKQG